MNKTTQIAFLEMSALKIPVPPPRIESIVEKIKTVRIMEENKKHPAVIAKTALRNIKPDLPLYKMMEIVKDALIINGYTDGPKDKLEEKLKSSSGSQFQDGDFIVSYSGVRQISIFIYKGDDPFPANPKDRGINNHTILLRTNVITIPYSVFFNGRYFPEINEKFRPATHEEKQLLLDELYKAGYSWDKERKVVVKNYWKPEVGQTYFTPSVFSSSVDNTDFEPYGTENYIWDGEETDRSIYQRGWVFQTKEECDAFCQKLNEAIRKVKRE